MTFLAVLALLLGGVLISAWLERVRPLYADQLFGWIPLNALWIAAAALSVFGAIMVLLVGAF